MIAQQFDGGSGVSVVFRQGDPVVVRGRAIFLRVPTVKVGISPLRPMGAVPPGLFQHVGAVEVVLAPVGGHVARIGDRVPPISGLPYCMSGIHRLAVRRLPRLDSRLAGLDSRLTEFDSGLTEFEVSWRRGRGLQRFG
ncbi:hypothetical protein ACVBEQ_16670 [Nakamurella sp. GG22]